MSPGRFEEPVASGETVSSSTSRLGSRPTVPSGPPSNRMGSSRTAVFLHAHPDDEAILTGGTIAKLSAAGHRVVLVVATRGELGEERPGLLVAGQHLGDRRTAETRWA